MLIDLNSVVPTVGDSRRSTVCIAGAGIAGLVLSTALADVGIDTHLLEGGGGSLEDQSQSIYTAEMAGVNHAGTHEGRFRLFGGSSTRWGGQLLPFTDDVFTPPKEVVSAAWPIGPETVQPYQQHVERVMGVSAFPQLEETLDSFVTELPEQTRSELRLRFSKWAPFSRRNLAKTLGAKAIRSGRITVFLHANLVECLPSTDGSRIECFIVRDFRGKQFRFFAQHYVLATGTIENSRLLLASRTICRNGVGNDFDRVGRCFHDHIEAPVATLTGERNEPLTSLMGPFVYKGTTYTGRLEPTVPLRKRLKLPAMMAYFTIEEPEDSPIHLVRGILRSFQRGEVGSFLLRHCMQVPAACLEIAQLAYSARAKNRRRVSRRARIRLRVGCEQWSPANRIRLSETAVDALGLPRTVIDWKVEPDEVLAMRRYTQVLRREFNRIGVLPLEWDRRALDESSDAVPDIRDTNHPMGGTIMGTDRTRSVVDENLQVHGLSNLHIASCSTFPSGGSSNPTFTMMCLAARLSERLSGLIISDELKGCANRAC